MPLDERVAGVDKGGGGVVVEEQRVATYDLKIHSVLDRRIGSEIVISQSNGERVGLGIWN